jgi:serine/threonine protein kinase
MYCFRVKLAKDDQDEWVAMKLMKRETNKANSKLNEIFDNEIKCMQNLSHPNIVKMVNYSNKAVAMKEDGSELPVNYIAMEYAENGEIFDFIAESGKFSEAEARYYFHQLIDALEYMHGEGYSHRDIKPENLLLDENFDLKVADFGFTTTAKICRSKKGTYGYMCPEILAGQEYKGTEADLFASAVILFILLSQHPPFVKAEPTDRYYKRIAKDNGAQIDKFWKVYEDEGFTESFKDLFSRMVAYDPADRLTLQEVKDHEWFNGPVCTSSDIFSSFSERKTIIQGKGKFDVTKGHRGASKKRRTTKSKKNKKFTKFFVVSDGDDLIDAVVELAARKGFKFVKSEDYYRVELTINQAGTETIIVVNVVKNPEGESRCLEFIKRSGDKDVFSDIFNLFKKHCKGLFKYDKGQ